MKKKKKKRERETHTHRLGIHTFFAAERNLAPRNLQQIQGRPASDSFPTSARHRRHPIIMFPPAAVVRPLPAEEFR